MTLPEREFLDQWVKPFYMQILHGNYTTTKGIMSQPDRFVTDVRRALQEITPDIAERLISGHWRESITGSWFAGLNRIELCRSQIGERLLESQMCYAGQSHAFAMACFADDESADFLVRYLEIYLARNDSYYDQDWAMPALMWIDAEKDSNHADRFLAKGGLWESFTADKADAWDIETCRESFWAAMQYCQRHFSA